MTRKEVGALVLSKVADDKKEEFIVAFRDASGQEEQVELLEKFGVNLTDEEMKAITSEELSEEDLDEAAGGCMCFCDPFLCKVSVD